MRRLTNVIRRGGIEWGKEMNLYVNGTLTINVEQTAAQLRKLIHELSKLAGQPAGTILSTKLNIPLAKECVLNFKKIEEKTPTVN
jgi:hypothetical protein